MVREPKSNPPPQKKHIGVGLLYFLQAQSLTAPPLFGDHQAQLTCSQRSLISPNRLHPSAVGPLSTAFPYGQNIYGCGELLDSRLSLWDVSPKRTETMLASSILYLFVIDFTF